MINRLLSFFLLLSLSAVTYADFEQDLSATHDIPSSLRELYIQANQGNASAQLDLGKIFITGKLITRNEIEAVKWFTLSAKQGNAQAQFNLGVMYATGQGITKDDTLAAHWYQEAANQGLPIAQLNLGVAYADGAGVTKDEAVAAKWLRLAANQGEAQAQFNLGVMYANGQGVTKNLPVAYRYAKLAVAQGHEIAPALLKDLSTQMTAQELLIAAQIPDTASKKTVTATDKYYLQLGAFKSAAQAEQFSTETQQKLGKIEKSFGIFPDTDWVRVQIGPYENQRLSQRDASRVKNKLGFEPLLKKH